MSRNVDKVTDVAGKIVNGGNETTFELRTDCSKDVHNVRDAAMAATKQQSPQTGASRLDIYEPRTDCGEDTHVLAKRVARTFARCKSQHQRDLRDEMEREGRTNASKVSERERARAQRSVYNEIQVTNFASLLNALLEKKPDNGTHLIRRDDPL
jgi:uncharacterized protein YbbK (DUF523 family)